MLVRRRHLRTTLATAVATLALVLAGCSQEGPAAEPAVMGAPATEDAPQLDPMAGAPAVGACYRLNARRARASTNDSAPVDCFDDHTTYTYHVGTFPADAVTPDLEQISRECANRLAEGVGLSRRRLGGTIIDWIYFEPTTTQWSAGARWFRCDANAPANGRLRELPGGSAPIFDTDQIEPKYLRCISDPDLDGRNGQVVTCDRPHDYEWAGPFEAEATGGYPGRDRFLKIAEKPCGRITGADSWWVTWPLEDGWSTGDRTMTCYRPA